MFLLLLPCWFFLINSERVKAVNLFFFSAFSKLSLKTFMSNLVLLTRPNFQILEKTQTGVFSFSEFLVESLINQSSHNSRTNHDIDMKLRPLTKFDERNMATSKKLTMTSCWQMVTSLSFF